MTTVIKRALRENERFLRHTQQIAGLGAYVLDIATGDFMSSEMLDGIFGLKKEDPHTYEDWLRILHPDDREMMSDYFRSLILNQHVRFDKEYRIVRASDGEVRWVHGYGDVEYNKAGRPIIMIGTIQDITPQKEAEITLRNFAEALAQRVEERTQELKAANATLQHHVQQLRTSEALLAEMGRMSGVGGWELDVRTGKGVWTEEVFEIHGLDKNLDPGGLKSIEFYTPEARPVIAEAVRRCMQQGESYDLELQFINASGQTRWIHTIGKADLEHGKIYGTFQDITDRKLADDLLKQKNAALDNSVGQLRKLAIELTQAEEGERKRLAAILHDHVQQYMAAATMKVSLLDSAMPADEHARIKEQIQAHLREALEASRSLTVSLCPPVLLEAGLVPGLRWLAEWIGKKHGLAVDIKGSESAAVPGPLCILLFQTVRELLFNVVKHAGVRKASVSLSQPDRKSLRLAVVDSGAGFTQGDSLSRHPSGGFGLFHLRERLAYIGGSLDVVSAVGKGTRVSITVPL
jgi:PAS domain S-box-containing protein